jgi:membrane protease YdiL (CAAX protease family)
MVLGILLSSIVASAWLGASGSKKLSLGGLAASQIGLWVGLVGATALASRRKGTGSLAVDFGLRVRPLDVVIGAVAGLAAQLGLEYLVVPVLSPLLGNPDVSKPVKDLVNQAHGIGVAVLVVFVVVGAPVVEELFFRGLLLRSLQRRMGNPPAVAVSAVLFGLAHMQALPGDALVLVLVSLTLLGLLLAALAVRTGRLGPGMLAHAAFNGITVVAVLVSSR